MVKREELRRIAARYESFAAKEARGESPAYERLTLEIARHPELLSFIAALPEARQQPNLVLAAVRWLHGVPESANAMAELVRRDGARIRTVILSRTTQTNEPARCAVLLPALAQLPQPLALIEVGASAGLCLLPDRYGYDYGGVRLGAASAVFTCRVSGAPPLPRAVPEIAWRAGLDLKPLSVSDDDAMRWLETLVWPGQEGRLVRLRAAIAAARAEPPPLRAGDLLTDLEALIAEAPPGATPVVFHSAVLAYVDAPARQRFAAAMRASPAVWIANESPRVFPAIAAKAPAPWPRGRFLLAVDGEPVAWTGPHGQSLDWFGA